MKQTTPRVPGEDKPGAPHIGRELIDLVESAVDDLLDNRASRRSPITNSSAAVSENSGYLRSTARTKVSGSFKALTAWEPINPPAPKTKISVTLPILFPNNAVPSLAARHAYLIRRPFVSWKHLLGTLSSSTVDVEQQFGVPS